MLLHWYACISINTYCYKIYHISLEMVWWVLSNASLIVWICSVTHAILANKDFTVTNDLISQLFVITFVHSTYMQIVLIWGFIAQFSLGKLVYWLWRYKLNEVFFFFFLNQQFITRLAVEDRGSYFCNYVQREQTNNN